MCHVAFENNPHSFYDKNNNNNNNCYSKYSKLARLETEIYNF